MSNCNFINMPSCIIQHICDNHLEFPDIKNLKQVNKKCNKIKIKNFNGLSKQVLCKLTDVIIKNYTHLETLYISNKNTNLTIVDYIDTLDKNDPYTICLKKFNENIKGT